MSGKRWCKTSVLLVLGIAYAVCAAQSPPNQSNGSASQQKQQDKGSSQQQSQPQQSQQAAPAPLFQGKATLKSSRQGKDTASAGFNGIGPDGNVQNSVLNANPSPSDAQNVAAMAATSVSSTELSEFIKQGNLNGKQ